MRAFLLVLLLLVAPITWAAITFDAASHDDAFGTSLTSTAHTIGSGSDVLLVVTISQYNSGSLNDITAVTWNSVSMTSGPNVEYISGTARVSMYYLAGATTGNQTLSVTVSGSGEINAAMASYHGVDQTTPATANNNTASGTSTTPSTSVTSVTSGNWVIDGWSGFDHSPSSTTGTNQTERVENDNGGGQEDVGMSDSTESGSVTMSWSGTSTDWGIVAQEFAAASGGPAGPSPALLRRRGR